MKLYAWLWYHTEFWLKPSERRPYTFIIRDFYHKHPIFIGWLCVLAGFTFGKWLITPDAFVLVSMGILLGHLFWGKPYIEGEQEKPEYNPDKPNQN